MKEMLFDSTSPQDLKEKLTDYNLKHIINQ